MAVTTVDRTCVCVCTMFYSFRHTFQYHAQFWEFLELHSLRLAQTESNSHAVTMVENRLTGSVERALMCTIWWPDMSKFEIPGLPGICQNSAA